MHLTNKDLPNEYNSWFYRLRLRVFLREVYHDLFPKPEKVRLVTNTGIDFKRRTGGIYLQIGAEVHEKHSWLIGGRTSFNADSHLGTTRLISNGTTSSEVEVAPGYSIVTLHYGRYIKIHRKWQLQMQVGGGYGKSYYSFQDFRGQRVELEKETVITANALLRLHYQVFPWLSPFLTFGTLNFVKGDHDLMKPFEGFNLGFGLKFRFGKSTLNGEPK